MKAPVARGSVDAMSHRLVWIGLALWGCGGGTPAAKGPANASALCVDPATAGGVDLLAAEAAAGDPEVDEIYERSEDPWIAKQESAQGGGFVGRIDASCERDEEMPCGAELVRFDGATVAARVALPAAAAAPAMGLAPNEIHAVWEDAERVVWVRYRVLGAPEAAVGATWFEHLAGYDAASLALRGDLEVGRFPASQSLDTCTSTLAPLDADCDGDPDLVQTMTCRPLDCDDDAQELPELPGCANPTVTHSVHLRGPDGTFTAGTV